MELHMHQALGERILCIEKHMGALFIVELDLNFTHIGDIFAVDAGMNRAFVGLLNVENDL